MKIIIATLLCSAAASTQSFAKTNSSESAKNPTSSSYELQSNCSMTFMSNAGAEPITESTTSTFELGLAEREVISIEKYGISLSFGFGATTSPQGKAQASAAGIVTISKAESPAPIAVSVGGIGVKNKSDVFSYLKGLRSSEIDAFFITGMQSISIEVEGVHYESLSYSCSVRA